MLKIFLSPKYRLTFLSVMLGVLMMFLAQYASNVQQNTGENATYGGAFTMVDDEGKAVTESIFNGKFSLIFFGYTFCPDICPNTLSKLAELYEEKLTPAQQKSLQVIFVTVDPQRDTLASLKEYVEVFQPTFMGLTGTEEETAHIVELFDVYAVREENEEYPEDYLITHSGWLYLMGPDGAYITRLNHEETVEEMYQQLLDFL